MPQIDTFRGGKSHRQLVSSGKRAQGQVRICPWLNFWAQWASEFKTHFHYRENGLNVILVHFNPRSDLVVVQGETVVQHAGLGAAAGWVVVLRDVAISVEKPCAGLSLVADLPGELDLVPSVEGSTLDLEEPVENLRGTETRTRRYLLLKYDIVTLGIETQLSVLDGDAEQHCPLSCI